MKRISIVLSAVFLAFAGAAWGQECQVTVSPLNFGDYNSLSGAPRDATAKIKVTCNSGIPFTVKLDKGGTSGETFHRRKLKAKKKRGDIMFNLYRDSARQEVWGDGTDNTFVVTGTGTGSPVVLTVYGRVPARQSVSEVYYSDQINVIVESESDNRRSR